MTNRTKTRRPSKVLKLASAALLAALACGSWAQSPGGAPAMQLASIKLADLETAFWVCEYAATTHGNANVPHCIAVNDELKARKFGGDFEALLKWWQQNRAAAYQRLAAIEVSAKR